MTNGNRYLLYLEGKQNQDQFAPVGGPQGIFELTTDGTVKPHGRAGIDPLAKKLGQPNNLFLEEARQSSKHEP